MALTFTDATVTAISNGTPANGAHATSSEIDRGANTIVDGMQLFLSCTTSSEMAGNITVTLYPLHTTGGTVFDESNSVSATFVGSAAAHDFERTLDFPMGYRYYKLDVLNSTGKNMTDLDVTLQMVKVTA